jgi:outer membrane protein OmpA-like peptidoglycan-associated protein
MKLSDERAKSVEECLSSKGIDKSRLHSKGFAETQPIADNTTEAGRKQNRRVEFIIVFITESLKQ